MFEQYQQLGTQKVMLGGGESTTLDVAIVWGISGVDDSDTNPWKPSDLGDVTYDPNFDVSDGGVAGASDGDVRGAQDRAVLGQGVQRLAPDQPDDANSEHPRGDGGGRRDPDGRVLLLVAAAGHGVREPSIPSPPP